jgi:hypothetical protein
VGRQLDTIKLLSKSWEKCKTHTQNLLLQINTKKASSSCSSASSASDQPGTNSWQRTPAAGCPTSMHQNLIAAFFFLTFAIRFNFEFPSCLCKLHRSINIPNLVSEFSK